ncbi:MAG TPA: TylF/MycF/NovP-related O-methyltransferase [Verrucomicrobiae bacterium]|jgi:hypothetical protein|nr:TylF/MycF/NovP-related O-methyltransferase [Verrucomicrobiae bacterium]
MSRWLHRIAGSRLLKPVFWSLHMKVAEGVRHLIAQNQSNIDYERHIRARRESVDYLEALEAERGRPIRAFPTRESLFLHGLSLVPKTQPGLILEFGVWKGESVNFISKHTPETVFGFDSFEGLPEVWNSEYQASHFKMSYLPKVRKNVQLVKGWFNETLPPFLEKHPGPLALLHVDSDIYSSAKTVLELLAPRMRGNDAQGKGGTVIIFDEFFNYPGWRQHEFKAFQELLTSRNFAFEPISYNSCHSQFCVQISRV